MKKLSWRRALFALGAALVVIAVAAGFTVRKSASDIHIAMIAPLTGPYVFVGGPERDSAQKAVDGDVLGSPGTRSAPRTRAAGPGRAPGGAVTTTNGRNG